MEIPTTLDDVTPAESPPTTADDGPIVRRPNFFVRFLDRKVGEPWRTLREDGRKARQLYRIKHGHWLRSDMIQHDEPIPRLVGPPRTGFWASVTQPFRSTKNVVAGMVVRYHAAREKRTGIPAPELRETRNFLLAAVTLTALAGGAVGTMFGAVVANRDTSPRSNVVQENTDDPLIRVIHTRNGMVAQSDDPRIREIEINGENKVPVDPTTVRGVTGKTSLEAVTEFGRDDCVGVTVLTDDHIRYDGKTCEGDDGRVDRLQSTDLNTLYR